MLLSQHLAACVNLVPGITSLYRWQGSVCEDQECQLLIKTQQSSLVELERCILQHHPYEVPEIIAVPTVWGHQAYMEWIKQNLTT
ncbi:divalent-cation tolerance protein CutA [Ferrimonas gelatinilytica]|uniref:divalent-cation tolerance protein CutA n=1 Tax=Ferrimonas gelatinilytica TaxID=1255257 RepID=UPI0031EB3E4E